MAAAPFFWKGEDVPVGKGVVLNARATADMQFTLSPQHLPHSDDIPLNQLRLSVRSRYAQLGIHVGEYIPEIDGMLEETGGKKPMTITASITNFSARPVRLNEGDGLFRFFHCHRANLIDHYQDLECMIQNGAVKIGGREGMDWKIDPGQFGIMLRINNRRYIPPNPEPVEIASIGSYREQIDALLGPVPESETSILWIGETPHVTLDKTIEGVLSQSVVGDSGFTQGKNGVHINSHLIDAGSNWPIRVEVVSPTTPEKMPDFVLLRLAFAA